MITATILKVQTPIASLGSALLLLQTLNWHSRDKSSKCSHSHPVLLSKLCCISGVVTVSVRQNRWVKSGEYIQMSGRAGRRGKDLRGVCIMMVDESMDAHQCK